MEYDNTLLYCRSCKQKVNSETKKCPRCGAEDPFYFVKVRKVKKGEIWRALFAFVISIISVDFIEPKSKTVAGICFVVLFLILWIVLECSTKYVLREDIKKYSEEFKKICDEANDEVAFNVWKTKMDKIID